MTAPKASTTPAPAAASTDFTRLLLHATDLPAPENTYTATAPTPNPDGTRGAEILFVNHDQTRAIGDSIVILPDTANATSILQQTISSLTTSMPGSIAKPSLVGHSGTSISGMPSDRTKSITVLLFTEGPALARLEFDSAPGEPTSIDLIADIGQKQDIALRVGLTR